ncbi:5-hydroxytryptamine receptor 1A-like [Lytechinus pictus]|uniref:5-hydroxytryptamine receptor 1A-like n=1 Tax=Lytechinus pictus TaxID=7653 RepID=UPI0030B9B579
MATAVAPVSSSPAMNTWEDQGQSLDDAPPMPWMTIAYYTCEVILGFCAAVGNATIVIAVAATKKLHTVPNAYLVSLAITDFCMGVLGIPSLLLALNGYPRNYGLCMTLLTIVLLLDLCSMYSLLAHTFNQYYCTCRPLHYPTISTTNRVILHVFLAWTFPLAVALVMPIGWNNGDPSKGLCVLIEIVSMDFLAFMFFVGMIPPFIAMCIMYRSIFKAISKQMRQLEDLEKIRTRLQVPASSRGASKNGSSSVKDNDDTTRKSEDVLAPTSKTQNNKHDDDCSNCGNADRRDKDVNEKSKGTGSVANSFKRVEAERKKALFFCFLMLFLFCTWCPIFTLDSIIAFGIVPSINQHVLNLAVLLSHFNSAFNPVIYARKSEFRLVFRRWWARITCQNRRVHGEGSGVHSVSTVG